MNREAIYAALFAKLGNLPGIVTASRRLRHWDDVPQAEQPALFMAQRYESASGEPGLNRVWVLSVDVYLYARTGGNDPPSTVLNPLIDAVEAAMATEPISNKQTLGGLVQHAWIDGQIETDEGLLGDQGVVIIPITMKVA